MPKPSEMQKVPMSNSFVRKSDVASSPDGVDSGLVVAVTAGLSRLESRRSMHRVISTVVGHRADHTAIAVRVTTVHLADPKRVLAERKSNTSLDATAQDHTLKKFETADRVMHVLEFHEAHWSVGLGPVAKTAIARLPGEERLEFLLGGGER